MKKNILLYFYIIFCTIHGFSQQTWEKKSAPLLTKFNYINKIGTRTFVCAGRNMGNNNYAYYSDNEKNGWTRIPELCSTFKIIDIAETLYACSHDTMFKSLDNGNTWTISGNK